MVEGVGEGGGGGGGGVKETLETLSPRANRKEGGENCGNTLT